MKNFNTDKYHEGWNAMGDYERFKSAAITDLYPIIKNS